METFLEVLFLALLGGVILWQLVTGKVLDRSWRASTSKKKDPLGYWVSMILMCLIFLYLVFQFFIDE